MVDLAVILIIVCLVAAAVYYIRNEKKRGVTCIGCPHAAQCAAAKKGGCHSGKIK